MVNKILVNKILRYLKTTPSKELMFRKTNKKAIEAYTDSDWARSVVDRKSTSNYCTFVRGNLLTWRSKKQSVVARALLRPDTELWVWKYVRKSRSKKFCLIFIRSVRHQWSYSMIIKLPLASLTTQFNMIEPNILRLIGISSKKDLTVGAYAFRTFLQANRLLMFSPRGFSYQTSTFELESWESLIFTSQIERECWS